MLTFEAYFQPATGGVDVHIKNKRGLIGKLFCQSRGEWDEIKKAVSGPLSHSLALTLRLYLQDLLAEGNWAGAVCRDCGESYTGDGIADHADSCQVGQVEEACRKLLRFANEVRIVEG